MSRADKDHGYFRRNMRTESQVWIKQYPPFSRGLDKNNMNVSYGLTALEVLYADYNKMPVLQERSGQYDRMRSRASTVAGYAGEARLYAELLRRRLEILHSRTKYD